MSNRSLRSKETAKKVPGNSNSSVALTAVALQDHWVRTLALGKTFGPRKIGIGPAAKSKQKKEIKSVVDTGNKVKKDNIKLKTEEEYVLDIKPPPLTLAQKFGLVDAPKQLLTEAEWTGVKIKSNIREDSKQPCVICKEDFGLHQQVLLSCSHVFHRACLQAFEKYTGKKTCPMCRHEQYQSRVIHEGSKQYRLTCATKIQAVWRGYVVRCWYKKFRLSVPPTDPKLRRKFFEEKLQDITDRMVKSCDFSLHGFLQEMDQSLEASRNVFKNFDAMFNILSDQDWEDVQLKAVLRDDRDCPICLQDLALPSDNTSQTEPTTVKVLADQSRSNDCQMRDLNIAKSTELYDTKVNRTELYDTKVKETSIKRKRPTVLLSCSHVFHDTCLCTLEKLTQGDLRNNCPVCRAVYQKRVINI